MTEQGRSISRELVELLDSRPDLWAGDVQQAAWFERKAGLLDRIATESNPTDPAEVRELAEQARRRARRLRGDR